jgi:hypothetical protein
MKVKCDRCSGNVSATFLRSNCVYVEGKHYPVIWCNDCYITYGSTCSECLKYMDASLLTFDNDSTSATCDGCTIKCECGDNVPYRYMYLIEEEYKCSTCYEDSYSNCLVCEQEFKNQQLNNLGVCNGCSEGL